MAVYYNAKGTTNHSFKIGKAGPTLYQGNFVPSVNAGPSYVPGVSGDLFINNSSTPAIFVFNDSSWLQKADWYQNGAVSYTLDPVSIGSNVAVSGNALTISGSVAIQGFGTGIFFPDGSFQGSSASRAAEGNSGDIQFSDGAGHFLADQNLHYDRGNIRIGIGTNLPITSIQYVSVTLECTDSGTLTADPTVIDSFPVTQLRSAHYYVQITDEDHSWYHVTQITVVHDGLNAFKSEYNILVSMVSLGQFDVEVQSGKCNLIFTAFQATNKTMKVSRTAIAI